jgi:hypothetical protein
MNEQEEIILRVSQEQLNVILGHLGAGRWADVNDTIGAITRQASPQLVNLAKIADATAAAMEASAGQPRSN